MSEIKLEERIIDCEYMCTERYNLLQRDMRNYANRLAIFVAVLAIIIVSAVIFV